MSKITKAIFFFDKSKRQPYLNAGEIKLNNQIIMMPGRQTSNILQARTYEIFYITQNNSSNT